MNFTWHRHDARRPFCNAPWSALALAALLAVSLWAATPRSGQAAELTPGEKAHFLESICAEADNTDRCLNAGKLVLDRSMAWLVFEGCSGAGSRESVVACFDRAHLLAFELTGDPQFDTTYQSCNRFQGELVDEAKLLCYRSDFKYARNYKALRERAENSETGAAVLKE